MDTAYTVRKIAVVVAAVAIVAGCAGPAPSPPTFDVPPTTAPPSLTLSPAEIEMYGPRIELPGGLVEKQLGKVAQWGGVDGTDRDQWAVRMIVDRIELDPKCDRFVSGPDRKHRVVLSLRVETSERYQLTDGVPLWFEWSTVGADGVSEPQPGSMLDCRESTAFAGEMRPSAKYRGTVTLETDNPSGLLVFNDWAAWKYPVKDAA